MNIYKRNFKKIYAIFDLEKLKDTESYFKYKSPGYKDLFIEYFGGFYSSNYKVELSHFYLVNGDLVAYPTYEIEIDEDLETAEVVTYQNPSSYLSVNNIMGTIDIGGDTETREYLNQLLEVWLDKIIERRYKLAPEEKRIEEINKSNTE